MGDCGSNNHQLTTSLVPVAPVKPIGSVPGITSCHTAIGSTQLLVNIWTCMSLGRTRLSKVGTTKHYREFLCPLCAIPLDRLWDS